MSGPAPLAGPAPQPHPEVDGLHPRRAGLADVPAVARLVQPAAGALFDESGSAGGALRLVLAHVGLDRGELWVGVDDGGAVRSALALLPPRRDDRDAALLLALHLELGLHAPRERPTCAVPLPLDCCWLLLPGPGELPGLDVALRTADAAGGRVLTLSAPGVDDALAAAGFRPSGRAGVLVREPQTPLPVPARLVRTA